MDYTGSTPQWQSLPATKEEVADARERFHAAFPKAPCRVWTGKEATKTAFQAEAGKARYIHVATHGFFDLEHLKAALALEGGPHRGFNTEMTSAPLPSTGSGQADRPGGWNPLLLSGIVLARSDKEDGRLTAEELQDLDLRGTELVVLSACETGRGELAAGEGVLGLSRALVVAGARAFMLSLWKVPDASTRELMDGFYAGLWGDPSPEALAKGEKPLTAEEALRATQLRMLARDRAKGAFHPKDWGAWVLIR